VSLWPVLALAALAYAIACVAIWKLQSRLIFYPLPKLADSPAAYGVSSEDVTIPAPSFELHGWWMPAAPEAPIMLYLHGNGGNIGAYASQAARLRNLGYSVLIIDYRGYGQSSGPFPCEERVYEDSELAWQWLTETKKIPPRQICIYGHSLGGAVAIELATRHPDASALIVESSFTSALAMGKHLQVFRIFPLRALLTHHFNSVGKVANLRMPVLFMHGTYDLTVPCRMSRDLHAAAGEPKQLVIFSGAMHMNCGESAPDLYRDSVTRFVDRVFATSPPSGAPNPAR
jgi:pimeloyl-ACP methyl ester carboxylesterase